MKILQKKSKIATIALILVLTFSALITWLPAVNAIDFRTYAFISVAPNPVGVGQTATLVFWLDKLPPLGLQGSWDAQWEGITVEVTAPDGSKSTLGPFESDPVGSAWAVYTPTSVGTYTFQMKFPGQTVSAYDAYYGPSTSALAELVVQQDPIGGMAPAELPSDFWDRPISGELREWYTISGNWLGGATTGGGNTRYNASSTGSCFNPYTNAPNTAHIMWTKPIAFGGIIGGEFGGTGTSSYYTGREYEMKFYPPVIIQGRLYYNTRLGSSAWQGFVCVDLRTGEEIWYQDTSVTGNVGFGGGTIQFGQVYNFKSPNQYGGIPYLWDTSRSTWKMYDAFTGNWILDVANASSGTVVMSPNGDLLVYILNGQNNWLAMWNASRLEGMLGGETGTAGWQWRPPAGATLDWKTGIQWNLTVPDVPGTQSISLIGSDTLLATAAPPESFARAASWQIEVAYDMKTGQQLWMQNRTFPTATTTWGLMGNLLNGVYTEYIASTMEWYAYDVRTGTQIWGPTEPYTNAWSMYASGAGIAYGKLYDQNLNAIVAYDLDTGERLWEFTAPSSGFETAYGIFPFQQGDFTIADGKIYTATTHSHTEPLYRGAKLIALDAETGNQIWDISFWRSGWRNTVAIADGYMVALNNYDNQIYCFGKGQTATTVTAPDMSIPRGSSVVIRGTVTDQSPGAAGTPAIADEDMTAWMEYLYMQKPLPMDATGVEVTLDTIDPNGNFIHIGTATSDMSGFYSYKWTPEHEGKYTIITTFEGSKSYYSSYAETAIGVDPAASAGGPIEPEPTEAPLITTEMAIILAAVIVAVALFAGFWIVRKRK